MSNHETIGKTDAARCDEEGHKLVTVKCMCGIKANSFEAELAAARELGPCGLHPLTFWKHFAYEGQEGRLPELQVGESHCTLCDREKAAIAAALEELCRRWKHMSVPATAEGGGMARAFQICAQEAAHAIDAAALQRYTGAAIAAALRQAASICQKYEDDVRELGDKLGHGPEGWSFSHVSVAQTLRLQILALITPDHSAAQRYTETAAAAERVEGMKSEWYIDHAPGRPLAEDRGASTSTEKSQGQPGSLREGDSRTGT